MSVTTISPPGAAPPAAGPVDERVVSVRLIVRLLQRPELGALLGAIAVYIIFSSVDKTSGHKFTSIAGTQNWTDAASTYGILAVLWWIGITVVATWVLSRTTFGNWIFAVGGDANAARSVGVPVARTKVILFVCTATAAALVGIMTALRFQGIQSGQGVGQEFFYIIAAVVGGCLLTGGYGSAIGATIGAAIIGMAQIGIIFANWDSNWYYTFLGVILFLAVGVNTLVRRRAMAARRCTRAVM